MTGKYQSLSKIGESIEILFKIQHFMGMHIGKEVQIFRSFRRKLPLTASTNSVGNLLTNEVRLSLQVQTDGKVGGVSLQYSWLKGTKQTITFGPHTNNYVAELAPSFKYI